MKVFLSHAHADEQFARELAVALTAEGLNVWSAEGNLYPGDNWALATGKALKDADAMVTLLSPEAVKSRNVQNEIEYALGEARFEGKLFPVVVRPTDQIPWILRRFRIMEAGGDPTGTGRRIAEALKDLQTGSGTAIGKRHFGFPRKRKQEVLR